MNFCPECASSIEMRLIDGEKRQACSNVRCQFVNWNNPVPVAAGLIKLGDKYLMARNVNWPEGMFSLISGFVEHGEVPHKTIARETTEELGLQTLATHFVNHYSFPRMNQVIAAYLVEAEGEVVLNEELAEYQLFTKEELLAYDFGPLFLGQFFVEEFFNK